MKPFSVENSKRTREWLTRRRSLGLRERVMINILKFARLLSAQRSEGELEQKVSQLEPNVRTDILTTAIAESCGRSVGAIVM